ncbi:MAG TPA: hypothetical protein GXZ87_08625 [Bacteroidales bacterium]|nr:hypothetical protein [Bacteroidales bacterium]
MKKYFLAIMAIAVMTMSFTSCKTDEPKVTEGISGSIGSGETLHLKAGEDYLLNGPLIIEDGGILTIDAGTVIKAKKGFSNYILVLQGGKINANGTAEKPIRMTADIDKATAGHWGGLIINGKAPLTSGQTSASTEINTAYIYGGDNPADNSGVLTYVMLEYTGARSSADVEHNGLTLNAVGNGTKIENIYVYEGSDDGIEFFGGSVNVKNLLVVNSDDDMFDFTQGYNGTLENAYGIWEKGFTSTESDPRGIEADGNFDGNFADHTNQSNFTVKNMTIDLRLDHNNDKTTQMQDVIKVRRGAKATVINALVKGTGATGDLIDLTDKKGAGDPTSSISLTNSLTNPFAGKEINGEAPNAKVEAGNTGCPTNIFSWTGYKF